MKNQRYKFPWKVTFGVIAALSMLLTPIMSVSADAAESSPSICAPLTPYGAMWVTADCVDPDYNNPVIDSEVDLTTPVQVHKVSGHFEGTEKKFNFYFPPKDQWEGRFYQLVYPTQDENAIDESISFGVDSGAYTVQTNAGAGYRVDAAAAKFSKTVAASYYGSSDRIYGYIYGGSGGSFQTIGSIENSIGVWDGAAPFVPAVPTSIPNNFFIRAFAGFVLGDKAPMIADAVSPGGSGDPYATLNDMEKAVLLEVTKMGIPLRSWEDYEYLLSLKSPQNLLSFGSVIRSMDPTYADDFWSKSGYLGTEQSALGDLFRSAKIDEFDTITQVNLNEENTPISLSLESVPLNPKNTGLDYALYTADGTTKIGTLSGTLDPATKVFAIGSGNSADVLDSIQSGVKLHVDNKWSLALLSYHRHQSPKRAGFYPWDQFKSSDGTMLYPQRTMEIGSLISRSVTGGGTYTGKINGKVIMVSNLMDDDAYPWHGDWYSARVKESLGDTYNDNFRLWYNDNADHIQYGPRTSRLVQYDGIYQQALRDLSAWVENDVTPPQSTNYEVNNGQIVLPDSAESRLGIQPVVDLKINGASKAQISAGKSAVFTAKIEVPPMAGEVVAIEWDFEGNGEFTAVPVESAASSVSAKHTYTTPGKYFPALRVTLQRDGDKASSFAKVQNLGRVRVEVKSATTNVVTTPVTVNEEPNRINVTEPTLNAEGKATTAVDADTFNKASAFADDIYIKVPSVDSAKGYDITLPAKAVMEGNRKQTIEISTEFGTFKLSSTMFNTTQLGGAQNVTLSVSKADIGGLSDTTRASIGDRPVLDITIKVDGVVTHWNNPNSPINLFIPYTPTAEELADPEHFVVWFIDTKGAAVVVPSGKYDAKQGGIVFTTTHLSKYAVAYVKKSFNDISNHEWARKQIEVLASKGIINGTSANTFSPEAAVKRADFMLLLVHALGLTSNSKDNFDDVAQDAYYAEALAIAKENGIAQGVGGNRFNPEASISRQDMMVLIDKALAISGNNLEKGTVADLDIFADKSSVASYAQQSVATLYKNGIIKGNGGKVNPSGTATRAEAAVLIYRIYNLGS